MALMEWTNEFSVDSKEMDDQHKKLFAIINNLDYGIKSNQGIALLINILAEMKEYSIFHFSKEELFLKTIAYPGLAQQQNEHKRFIAKVDGFKTDFKNLMSGNSETVLTFLKNWWTSHILEEDRKYSNFINKNKQ